MNDISFYVTWDSAKKSQTIESIAFFLPNSFPPERHRCSVVIYFIWDDVCLNYLYRVVTLFSQCDIGEFINLWIRV